MLKVNGHMLFQRQLPKRPALLHIPNFYQMLGAKTGTGRIQFTFLTYFRCSEKRSFSYFVDIPYDLSGIRQYPFSVLLRKLPCSTFENIPIIIDYSFIEQIGITYMLFQTS